MYVWCNKIKKKNTFDRGLWQYLEIDVQQTPDVTDPQNKNIKKASTYISGLS